jgi:hypothetical protein
MQMDEASKSALHNEVLVLPETIRLPATGFEKKNPLRMTASPDSNSPGEIRVLFALSA